MLEIQRHVTYSEIATYVAQGELESALLSTKKLMDKAVQSKNLEEQCWLNLFFAWIYYLYPNCNGICIQYCHKVLKHKEIIDDNIVIQAYLIRSLIHLRLNKLKLVHDTIEECLKLNPHNGDINTLQQLLHNRMKVD